MKETKIFLPLRTCILSFSLSCRSRCNKLLARFLSTTSTHRKARRSLMPWSSPAQESVIVPVSPLAADRRGASLSHLSGRRPAVPLSVCLRPDGTPVRLPSPRPRGTKHVFSRPLFSAVPRQCRAGRGDGTGDGGTTTRPDAADDSGAHPDSKPPSQGRRRSRATGSGVFPYGVGTE